jgi:hypothetical protein
MPLDVEYLMTPLQKELWAEIRRLERFAQQHEIARHDARSAIHEGLEALAQAMDELQHPMDDNDQKPRRSGAWEPWEPIEDWILRRGSGTGSARDMAVCYLAHMLGIPLLGIPLDMERVYGGTLDEERTRMIETALAAPRPADVPMWPFWRIFWLYEQALEREMQNQGLDTSRIGAPGGRR